MSANDEGGWFRMKQTEWLHESGDRVIQITSVLQPENNQNFLAIEDRGGDAKIIGYFNNIESSVIGIEEYIRRLESEEY